MGAAIMKIESGAGCEFPLLNEFGKFLAYPLCGLFALGPKAPFRSSSSIWRNEGRCDSGDGSQLPSQSTMNAK